MVLLLSCLLDGGGGVLRAARRWCRGPRHRSSGELERDLDVAARRIGVRAHLVRGFQQRLRLISRQIGDAGAELDREAEALADCRHHAGIGGSQQRRDLGRCDRPEKAHRAREAQAANLQATNAYVGQERTDLEAMTAKIIQEESPGRPVRLAGPTLDLIRRHSWRRTGPQPTR